MRRFDRRCPISSFFSTPRCLNEQATVNRFVGHAHALVIGILDLQPSGNLFRRPIQNQFTRNNPLQLHMNGQKAPLGPQGRPPGPPIRFIRPILSTATMTSHLPAHRRRGALQTFRNITNRRTGSEPPRKRLSPNHRQRYHRAPTPCCHAAPPHRHPPASRRPRPRKRPPRPTARPAPSPP